MRDRGGLGTPTTVIVVPIRIHVSRVVTVGHASVRPIIVPLDILQRLPGEKGCQGPPR